MLRELIVAGTEKKYARSTLLTRRLNALNYFDTKSRYTTEYVDGVIAKIKRDLEAEENKS